MNKEYAKKSLEWLARFHAASYRFLADYEGGLQQFNKDFAVCLQCSAYIFFVRRGISVSFVQIDHPDWIRQSDVQMTTFTRAFLQSSDSAFKAIIKEHLKDKRPDLVQKVQVLQPT